MQNVCCLSLSIEISMNGASWQFVEVCDMSSPRDLCCMSSLPSVPSLLSLPAVAAQQSRNVTENNLKKNNNN